jgi:hypothetical protein
MCHHLKTPLSSQVGNVVLIDAFNVFSRVLSMVLFLRVSCCFPAEKKTRSIPPPDAGQPWNCLKAYYQAFFWVLIDLIVELLGLIIKPFDNQTES